MLAINSLIEWLDDNGTENLVERVLDIDPVCNCVHVIDINPRNQSALPELRELSYVTEAIAAETALLRLDNQTKPAIFFNSNPITKTAQPRIEKHRQKINKRWDIVRYMVDKYGAELFNPTGRGRAIQDAVNEFSVSGKTALKYLRKIQPDATGKNLTEEDKENIRHAIRVCIIAPGPNKPRDFFKNTHEYLLATVYYSHNELIEGTEVPTIVPNEQRVSRTQVRDLYYKEFDYKQRYGHRYGKNALELRQGARIEDIKEDVFAAGSLFQVDATTCDIYLLSAFNREQIIGRPVMYIISDTRSHMICGYSISLEGPSWSGALIAIVNMLEDKVEHCARLGIKITEAMWPTKYLPFAFVADRGEFEGYMANLLLDVLGIDDLIVLPSFRPDWKSIVESRFLLLNANPIRFIPGTVYRVRDRTTPDYRLDARLNLNQFRYLMARAILRHNARPMSDYLLTPDMVRDHVQPRPLELWHWSIANEGGLLKTFDPGSAYRGLMPREHATVTERGISLGGLYYTCASAEAGYWANRANKKRWSVTLAHDPRSTDEVYLCDNDGQIQERCLLTPAHLMYSQMSSWDALDQLERVKQEKTLAAEMDLQAAITDRVQRENYINQIPLPETGNKSNAERTGSIRENRKGERSHDAAETVAAMRALTPSNPPSEYSNSKRKTSGAPPDDLELLKQMLEMKDGST